MDHWTEDIAQSRELATGHIHKAVSLAPDLGLVQVAYANYLIYNHQFDKAEYQLKCALDTNPNDTEAIAMLAVSLCIQGKAEAALEQAELALKLDPYHAWVKWIKAESQFFCGRFEDCLATIADTGNAPGFIQIYNVAANTKLGRLDNAKTALEYFLRFCRDTMLSMPDSIDKWREYYRVNAPFIDPARNQEIIDCLVQAGLCDDIAEDTDEMPSLLVLPFSNLSGDPEQEYFSDGISESIIVNLSSFNGLNVKSRHTSFAFKNSAKGIDEIAEELAVQYIVEGSIRKFGDKIRITVQLGETESGNQLWGERFESELEDLFALEEILVKNITGSLGGRIGKEIVSASMHKSAKDLKSYDYLMRGLHHTQQFSSKENSIAREHFEKCLEHDPDNSEANALLAGTYVIELYENWTADRSESKRLMVVHAEKSLQLEPNDALAHAFMAEILLFLRDFDRASHHVERAMELNPNLPDCYSMKCSYLTSVRRYDEALENAGISMQIDPHHYYMCWNAGEVYRTCGQYERAIRTFRSMSHMPPSIQAQIAASLAGLGKIDEARSEMRSYLEAARRDMPHVPANRDEWRSFWYEYMPYQYEEDSESFFQLLLKAGLFSDSIDSQGDIPSIAVLPFENMSGDPEQEYFSDGITTSIILGLGLFHGISIKSQKSSFSFKRSKLSSVEIARALEADYLVEGSIRKSATKVRVSVQLIESESGTQIWGKQYDQELEDILELEQELSQAIAATISGRIGHEIQRSAVRKPAKDLKSYDYLMRGLHHFGKFTAEDMVIARELIQKCIDIDPENALAHTNLAVAYDVELLENWTSDRKLAQKQSTTHFEIALQLDPEDALAHAYLAEHLIFLGDFNKAEFHADRAIELNPTASEGYVGKADLLGYSRQADKALVYADQGLQLDPHSVGAGWVAGDVYRNAGQYKKAIKIFRSISHPPPSISGLIAVCFADLGLIDEARTEMRLYQKLAKQQMPKYPESTEEWRQIWGHSAHYLYREDFNIFFNQLLAAGLCDEFVVSDDDLPSIAVLPFENMSDDPEQEFFSDGITTDIIATLSKFNHMRIVARHSTTQYKNREASIAEIAKQQNVRYILEGSVRKSCGRIRVNAELIDSHNEKICWSERYDRDLDDLFAAQDELTKKIALAMKVHLDDGDMALHRSTGTTSIKAWQLTLAAIDLQDTYIRENILEARSMAKQAIDLDPAYPYAWVVLGWTFWQEVYSGWSDSLENSLAEAGIAQQKALDLVPLYSEAWSLGGLIHLMKHEPDEALADCRKAVELEPGNAEIQALMAFCLIYVGDYENAQLHDQNMLKLCPVLPNWYYLIGGEIAQIQGNFEEAANYFQQGIDVEPNSPLCRFYLIDVMMELGNESRARELADEIRALDNKVAGKGLVRTVSQDKALRARFKANLEKFDLY